MLPDLSSLNLFLQAVELGSLSKAAEACHLSLSAASRRLATLEDHLGTPLFDRHRAGVVPTPAGEALTRHAKAVLMEVGVLLADLSDYAGGAVGRVRVYANTSAMSQDLPQRLSRWSELNPNIKLEVKEVRSRGIVEAVRNGSADIGVVTTPPEADLRFEPYGPDQLCVVVPAGHELRVRRIAFSELLDQDFIGLDDSAFITQVMKKTAEAAGKFLRLRIQVQSFEVVCRLVAAGQGVGVLPRGAVDMFKQSMHLRLIDLIDQWAVREMYVCVKQGRLPAATNRFLQFLVEG